MADTQVLEACGAIRGGSSPSPRTKMPEWWNWQTHCTQNAAVNSHEGSSPSSGTKTFIESIVYNQTLSLDFAYTGAMKLQLLLLICVAAPCIAQEPTRAIVPADPISVAVRTPITPTASSSHDSGAPIIYPNPLPKVRLGEIARTYRLIHAAAPKATKVANDETPIVAEVPKAVQQ
jgi:hypothetical protein